MAAGNSSDSIYIGLDLGGSTVKGALATSAGELLGETQVDGGRKSDEKPLEAVLAVIRTLRDSKQGGGRVAAIGIGVPGLVNVSSKRIEVLPNRPSLSQIDIIGEVSQETGLPVVLDNDANAAAYAELQVGA